MQRKNVRIAAREAMQVHGYDPLDQLVQFAQAESTSGETKLKIAETLLPYMYPKLSSITLDAEVSGTSHAPQAVLLRQILANPELADAAQKLSVAASMAALEDELGEHRVM